MSLPPEQINIKRRREEEPVDTLYIQSELHQTKRRFTDFVFQRVQVSGNDRGSASSSASPATRAQRTRLTPRSVSSSVFPSTSSGARSAATAGGGTVPIVRATSPGAEFREEKRLAAARKEAEEKVKRALYSSPVLPKSEPSTVASAAATGQERGRPSTSSGRESPTSTSPRSMRKFQISRSNTPVNLLRSTGSGVQKRRGDGAVAVLVEKLRRKPHSRQASMVADAASRLEGTTRDVASEGEPSRPRKRPVVNQAEKKWREERQTAISAAKEHITQVLEKGAQARQSNWENESDRLARDFEQIALELEGEMDILPTETNHFSSSTQKTLQAIPKPTLKYQPRTPNKLRSALSQELRVREENVKAPSAEANEQADESDGEYVYDTYIRRPLAEGGLLTNPLVDLEMDQELWLRRHGIDTSRKDIGVIVITQEDEEYWENFAEDDEEEDQWDSEDADSNAENNPANDYPDEELSWDDEEDDPMAVYNKYRTRAVSDDEEFDFDDSDSEGRNAARFGFSHVDSD